MRGKINCCFYPTTVLLIDDDRRYTKLISTKLKKHFLLELFNDSQKALYYVNNEYNPDPFIYHCIDDSASEDFENYTSSFKIHKIHQEVYNPDRFQQISVIVIDEIMPYKNGLQVCQEIKDPFCLKLMLTGEAGNDFAVRAFNEGIIDKFLQKNAMDLSKVLRDSIAGLQEKYFQRFNDRLFDVKNNDVKSMLSPCLQDPIFVDFFDNLCAKHHIVEYYLLDEYGSFLLLDKKATPSWLIVKSEEMMDCEYEAAREDDDISPKVLQALKDKTAVPYLHTAKDIEENLRHPEKFMHPASILKAEQTYYYSYVTRPDAYELQRDKILSLDQFLQQQTQGCD